jgi:hypothetical protein
MLLRTIKKHFSRICSLVLAIIMIVILIFIFNYSFSRIISNRELETICKTYNFPNSFDQVCSFIKRSKYKLPDKSYLLKYIPKQRDILHLINIFAKEGFVRYTELDSLIANKDNNIIWTDNYETCTLVKNRKYSILNKKRIMKYVKYCDADTEIELKTTYFTLIDRKKIYGFFIICISDNGYFKNKDIKNICEIEYTQLPYFATKKEIRIIKNKGLK